MIITDVNVPIVCDMGGCKNIAKYFIKKQVDSTNFYSLKLCENCAREIRELLNDKISDKGNKSENKKQR